MALCKRRPWQIEICGEQFRKADNLYSSRVVQQLIKRLLAQRAKPFNDLPCFLKRLYFSDIAEQFEQRALGYGHWYSGAAVRKGLEAEALGELGIE